MNLSRVIVGDDAEIVKKKQKTIEDERNENYRKTELIEIRESLKNIKLDDVKASEATKSNHAMETEAQMIPKDRNFLKEEYGEIDFSKARLVKVDGLELKRRSAYEYNGILSFMLKCHTKHYLKLFDDHELPKPAAISHYEQYAKFAVKKYNKICKKEMLRRTRLTGVRVVGRGAYYVTFSALDKAGRKGIYQAAVARYEGAGFILGLLRDVSNYRILAMLVLTGVEEQVAARKKLIASNWEM